MVFDGLSLKGKSMKKIKTLVMALAVLTVIFFNAGVVTAKNTEIKNTSSTTKADAIAKDEKCPCKKSLRKD